MDDNDFISDRLLLREQRQELFLALVADLATTDKAAAESLGLSRYAPIEWKRDPAFKARYLEAKKISVDKLIKEAERRAINGSDKLLEFLLCNYAPDKFQRQQKVEHSGTVDIASSILAARRRGFDDGSDLA